MTMNISLTGCFVLILTAVSAAHDVTSVLMKHIERMDAKIERMEENHRVEVRGLEEKMRQQETEYLRKISELDQRLTNVEERNGILTDENDHYRAEAKKVKERKRPENKTLFRNDTRGPMGNDRIEMENISEKKEDHNRIKLDDVNPEQASTETTRTRRAPLDGYNVAFSAYMDHTVDKMGPGQVLVYNQVLLNDGNGYNKHSGIFTAPIAGVYSFSFFLGEGDSQGEWIALWVNSENKIDAAVDSSHPSQDLQGGNTVNLKLDMGDVVSVKNLGDGHVEGSSTLRLTTFSGFLIYPVETSAVVGK